MNERHLPAKIALLIACVYVWSVFLAWFASVPGS